jgi:hypothetical protein
MLEVTSRFLRRRGAVAILIPVMAVGVGPFGHSDASVVRTSSPAWTTIASVPASAPNVSGMSCVSTSTCLAVSASTNYKVGFVLRTTDGGMKWSEPSVPRATGSLNDVSCVSTGTCIAVGQSQTGQHPAIALKSTNAGLTWVDLTIPTDIDALNGVACSTASDCVLTGGLKVADGLVLVTLNGGRTWSSVEIKSVRWTGLASCSASTACTLEGVNAAQTKESVVGLNLSTRHVTPESLPVLVGLISGFVCTRAQKCIAVGIGGSSTEPRILGWNGSKWSVESIPHIAGLALQNVTCATDVECWAVGDNSTGSGVSLATVNAGAGWQQQHVPGSISEIDYLTCPSATLCLGEGFSSAYRNVFVKLSI